MQQKKIEVHWVKHGWSFLAYLILCGKFAMLSPKMQRSVRVNENQLIMLSDKAQYDHSMVS